MDATADRLVVFLGPHLFLTVFVAGAVDAIGLPFPGRILLVRAGAFASTRVELALAIVGSALGSLLGDHVVYLAGARRGDALLALYCRLTLGSERCVENTLKYFRRFGAAAIVLGRYSTSVRLFAAILSGTGRIPYRRFLLYDLAARWPTPPCGSSSAACSAMRSMRRWNGSASSGRSSSSCPSPSRRSSATGSGSGDATAELARTSSGTGASRRKTGSCGEGLRAGILAAVKRPDQEHAHRGLGPEGSREREGVRATAARGVGAVGHPDPEAVPGSCLHTAWLAEAPGRVRRWRCHRGRRHAHQDRPRARAHPGVGGLDHRVRRRRVRVPGLHHAV